GKAEASSSYGSTEPDRRLPRIASSSTKRRGVGTPQRPSKERACTIGLETRGQTHRRLSRPCTKCVGERAQRVGVARGGLHSRPSTGQPFSAQDTPRPAARARSKVSAAAATS